MRQPADCQIQDQRGVSSCIWTYVFLKPCLQLLQKFLDPTPQNRSAGIQELKDIVNHIYTILYSN